MTDTEQTSPSCLTCLLCLREDYGYSNYTVEGATLVCMAGLNPALEGKDNPYSPDDMTPELAAALDVALTCPRYRFGAPATLDVDLEGLPYSKTWAVEDVRRVGATDDDEAAKLLIALRGTQS